MFGFHTRAIRRPSVATLVAAALLASVFSACSGGGGGGSTPTFSLQFVDPNESVDIDGGDKVVVHGKNFLAARVARVLFGDGNPGFGLRVISDTEVEITVPPALSGNPGPVDILVETLNFGTKGIFAGFTYVTGGGVGGGPPDPQTIVPTNFTATGAESFTISGSNLGPAGGLVNVNFAGVGLVQAKVSLDRQFATGNAPLAGFVPPATPIQVIVDNQGQGAEVPTRVNFNYAAPTSWLIGYQEGSGNASLPVKVAAGMAVVATSGTDTNWGNPGATGNDSLWLITGPPLASATVDLFALQPSGVRRLDSVNSAPIALDGDTVALYSPGPDGRGLTGDEVVLIVTNLQAPVPVVRSIAVPMLTPAPLGRISSTRIGMTTQGTGTSRQDEMRFITVTGGVPALAPTRIDIGLTHNNWGAGRTFLSIPYSSDGDTVFVFSLGPLGGGRAFGDANDQITRYAFSTGLVQTATTPFLHDKPIALSANRLVAPAQFIANPPSANDSLVVYDFVGGLFTTTYFDAGARIQTGGLLIIAPLGNGNVVLPLGGPNRLPGDADDQIGVFRDDGNGGFTQVTLDVAGRPLLTPLGDGSLIVFGRGGDLAPGTFDDRAIHIHADGAGFDEFAGAPRWMQGTLAAIDETRAFAIGAGADHPFYASGDEELLVFQSKSVGNLISTATLPMSGLARHPVQASPPLTAYARTPFVPVGPGWGLMQSPGSAFGFGFVGDRVLVVSY